MMWLRQLLFRRRLYSELSREIQEHLEERIDELVANGTPREEAVYAARREFGNVARIEERSREVWGWAWLDNRTADVAFAIRQLRRSPGLAFAVCLSLALGIGATTVIFSVVYAVLINPYPYQGADRMVHVHVFDKTAFLTDLLLSSSQFQQFQNDRVLDGAIAMDQASMADTGGDLPESVMAGHLSSNAFDYFGVPALMGREFSPEDARDALHPANVAVLSYQYWQTHYAGQSDVLGKTLQLNRENYTVIGILPKRFAWWGCDVYTPLKYSPDPDRTAMVFVRIKPNIGLSVAQAELQASIQAFAKETPQHFPHDLKIGLVPLNDIFVGSFSGTIYVIFGAVTVLLVIGCANASILLLARGVTRTHELALRAALGASRRRIVGQLLTESITLSLTSGLLGILIAYGGIKSIARYLPDGTFPGEASFQLSLPVLLFSTTVAVLAGIVFGAWPANGPRPYDRQGREEKSQHPDCRSGGTHRYLVGGGGGNSSHLVRFDARSPRIRPAQCCVDQRALTGRQLCQLAEASHVLRTNAGESCHDPRSDFSRNRIYVLASSFAVPNQRRDPGQFQSREPVGYDAADQPRIFLDSSHRPAARAIVDGV
jgi:MacB-like periplasmic core domain/FtsX-like permease family